MKLFFALFYGLVSFTSVDAERVPSPGMEELKPSKSRELKASEEQLKEIYIKSGKAFTAYCACGFDDKGQISGAGCSIGSRKPEGSQAFELAWDHAVSEFEYGRGLACWQSPVCNRENGRPFSGKECCEQVSEPFRVMAADMHNLFPAADVIRAARSSYPFDEIRGEARKFGECDVEIKDRKMEPPPSVRGDLARAYFYMSRQYGIPLLEKFEDMLRMWHVMDPPDRWEMDRNSLIEEIQGNRNPFIDHPELVERVRDF